MTSKLKCPVCPWCNQPKVLQDDMFVCANTDCSACAESFLHKALIQAKQDLEIARKALEEARINLAAIEPYLGDEYILDCKTDGLKEIDEALEQIEHKD